MEPPTTPVSPTANSKYLPGILGHLVLGGIVLWVARRHPWPHWREAVFYGVMTAQSLIVGAWLGLGRAEMNRLMLAFALFALLFLCFSLNTLADYGSMRAFNAEPMMMDQLFRSMTPAATLVFILFLQRRRGVWIVKDSAGEDEPPPFQISTQDLFIATFVVAVLLAIGRLLSHFPEYAQMLVLPACLVVLGLHIMWCALAPRFDWLSVVLAAVTFGVVAITPVFWLRYPPLSWPLQTTVVGGVLGVQFILWRARGLRLVSK